MTILLEKSLRKREVSCMLSVSELNEKFEMMLTDKKDYVDAAKRHLDDQISSQLPETAD